MDIVVRAGIDFGCTAIYTAKLFGKSVIRFCEKGIYGS